jgi:hypothetical protein
MLGTLALRLAGVELLLQLAGLALALLADPAGLEQCRGLPGQGLQCALLALTELAWLGVDDADSAQRLPAFGDDRRAGVEANVRRACHQWTVGETQVVGGVFDDQHSRGIEDRVGTEGQVAMGLAHIQANAGLEPLAFAIHQRHQRNRDSAQRAR